jgi:CheY-like chemotaxis protein/DNA-binding XRE family transcriptional regulator
VGRLVTTELVARIRSTAGITQEELARQLGVSFPTVNAWERGRSEPRHYHRASLDALAKAYGIIQGLTVLIIDDDDDVARVMGSLLEAHLDDVVVSIANSGTEGLLTCGAVKPDVVLLDVRMPGLDGLAVAEALKSVDGLERTRLVFVTGQADQELLDAAARDGRPVLRKPFQAADFTDVIDGVIGQIVASASGANGDDPGS